MDIRQLEAFVYTAKYQSFSLAAQKLYLSQPTVSSHICNLEKELHTQLLQRTTKALSMTPAGRRLYSYAAEILDLRHKAILELTSQQEVTLRVGVSSVPPPGPAMPVMPMPKSAPAARRTPRAISAAVSAETAPYCRSVSGETPSTRIFCPLE